MFDKHFTLWYNRWWMATYTCIFWTSGGTYITCTHGIIYMYTNYWRKEKLLEFVTEVKPHLFNVYIGKSRSVKTRHKQLVPQLIGSLRSLVSTHKVLKVINHKLRPTWQWQGRNIFDKHLARTRLLIISHDILVNAGDLESTSPRWRKCVYSTNRASNILIFELWNPNIALQCDK